MRKLPFGQAVYLWRRHRGLTQEALAQRSGIARPNVSAIERGKRDVSLNTLRALALGLQVRPGALVDGQSPQATEEVPPLSRKALERVADVVARKKRPASAGERELAAAIGRVAANRMAAAQGKAGRLRQGKRSSQAAWLELEAAYSPAVISSLLSRIADRVTKP